MSFQNEFTKDAGIEYPIICGAMFPCSNPELVAAASEGGGIAIIQPASLTYVHDWDFREGVRHIRSLTDKPIGFNALIEKGSKKYIDRMSQWIDIALEEDIRFFVTSLGKPDWVCERVHAKGGVVYHDVTNRKHALKGIDCGIDGLICVNNRAGGHLGEKSAAELYKELQDLGLPLICAGGVGSEKELAEVLAIGYDGVQMGTRFIATIECTSPQDYKDAIVEAKEEDIVWTNRLTGVPISVIRSKHFKQNNSWLMRRLLTGRFRHTARLFLNILSLSKLRSLSKKKGGSAAKKKQYFSAGKSVETVDNIESATVIMRRLGESLDSTV